MKKVSILSLIALFAIVISSCGSSNNVVNNNGISKRKYTKGFFFQRKSNLKTADTKVEDTKLVGDKSLAKTEKAESKKTTSKAKKEAKKTYTLESSDIADFEQTDVAVISVEKEYVPETRQFLSDGSDGIDWSVTENQQSATGESINEMPYENRNKSSKNQKNKQGQNRQQDAIFVLAVIFAILLPPLGVAIYTNIDWMKVLIALLLTILFILPGVIYALLVVFDVI